MTVVEAENEVLTDLLKRPMTPPDPAVIAAIESGPMRPAHAIGLGDLDRLLDPAPLEVETGWCNMPDVSAYVAVRTLMPGVTAEMVDWWFDWHPESSLRYRVWHPAAHISNSVDLPDEPGAKAHWGTVHHPVEDVGTGIVEAWINFRAPSEVGFSTDALNDPNVATIVCGFVGDHQRRMRHSAMAHVWLNEQGGLVLRSHFWLGAIMRPQLPGRLGDVAGRLVNRPSVRWLALPGDLAGGLARHCTEEYTNLAAILPGLYSEFA